MSAQADDMVLVPRAELEALRAENRRLRREAGDREALRQRTRRSSTSCRSRSRRSPTRFRRTTRCRAPIASIYRRTT
jgi:hypothetical protein